MNKTWSKPLLALAMIALTVPFIPMRSASALTISPLTIEYDVDPGENIVGSFRVFNEGKSPETFYPLAKDFSAGDTSGTPSFP